MSPARKYWTAERKGTQTPDEIMQKRVSGMSMRDLGKAIRIQGEGTIGLVQFNNCSFDGRIVRSGNYHQHPEEALILCLASSPDSALMRRLGKSIVVEIPDVYALKAHLDTQVGHTSRAASVRYTDEPGDRDHFTKSTADAWQQEFRLVWTGGSLGTDQVDVLLPGGLARALPEPLG